MKITLDVPNAKAEALLNILCNKYGLQVPEKADEKAALLNKCIKHDLITAYRSLIREQAIAQANATIRADVDVAETELEAELKARAQVQTPVSEQ